MKSATLVYSSSMALVVKLVVVSTSAIAAGERNTPTIAVIRIDDQVG
jgi:hypothetical protein